MVASAIHRRGVGSIEKNSRDVYRQGKAGDAGMKLKGIRLKGTLAQELANTKAYLKDKDSSETGREIARRILFLVEHNTVEIKGETVLIYNVKE